MKPLNLKHFNHEVFIILEPTDKRINRSIAWLVECKTCHKRQLAGAEQLKRGFHKRCIYCQISKVEGVRGGVNQRHVEPEQQTSPKSATA